MLGARCSWQDCEGFGRQGESRVSGREIRSHCEFSRELGKGNANGLQWMVKHPYDKLEWLGSENVPGIDVPQNLAEAGVIPSVTGDAKAAAAVVDDRPTE